MARTEDVGDPTDTCPCGSKKFVITQMSLTINDVPLVFDGSLGPNDGGFPYTYDDTKGDSEGWDRVVDDVVRCASCKKKFRPDIGTDLLVEIEEEEALKR